MKRLLCVLLAVAATGCLHVKADGRLERWAVGRAAWSVAIPGVGQIMNDQPGKGWLMLGLSALADVAAREWSDWEKDVDGNNTLVWKSDEAQAGYAAATIALRTWSGIDAYKVAKLQNETAPVRLADTGDRASRRLAESRSAPAEAGSPSARTQAGTHPVLALDPFGGQLSATLSCRF